MTRALFSLLVLAAAAGCEAGASARTNVALLEDADRALLHERYVQAADLYETFLADNPRDAERAELRVRAGKCRLGAGDPARAVRLFDQALQDDPPPPLRWEILFRRSVALRMAGEAVRAVEGFRSVAAAPPGERGQAVTNDELRWEYAMALFRAGDFKGGQAELARVNPKGPYERMVPARLGLTAFTVQVGAFGDESVARAEAGKLKGVARGITAERTLWLVTVGSFTRYDDAMREADRLKRQGYTDAFVLP